MIFVSLIMINGRWVKRQKRMHEHINLHCRTLADFVEFRREKNTHKKHHVLPCAAGCRIDSPIVHFQWFFPECKRTIWMLNAYEANGKSTMLRSSRRLVCAQSVDSGFYLFKFYWPLRVAVLKSQLVYVERLGRCNGNGGRNGNSTMRHFELCKPQRRSNDTANWLRLDAPCQRINFQMNKFNRVFFCFLLSSSYFPRNYS